MCDRDTTGNSSFVVAKPSTHCGKPSLNPSRSVVLSPLLSRDGEVEGMKQCADGIGWTCENEGNVRPEGEKRLCSPKRETLYIFLLLLMLLEKFCAYFFIFYFLKKIFVFLVWHWFLDC